MLVAIKDPSRKMMKFNQGREERNRIAELDRAILLDSKQAATWHKAQSRRASICLFVAVADDSVDHQCLRQIEYSQDVILKVCLCTAVPYWTIATIDFAQSITVTFEHGDPNAENCNFTGSTDVLPRILYHSATALLRGLRRVRDNHQVLRYVKNRRANLLTQRS